MHTVIAGGAGLIGSHLALTLLEQGHKVTVIDNFSTGHQANLAAASEDPALWVRHGDVTHRSAFSGLSDVTAIVHLACPAAPAMYQQMPVQTLRAGSVGTMNALEAAATYDARIVLASSSDVYGDTREHPQAETCRGAIDPLGPRSAYEVTKMFTEAAAVAYHRHHGVRAGVIRPFNVYGPHMWPGDSRVVPAFCAAALSGQTLRLHGGKQTRSLLYVDDAVAAVRAMLECDAFGPVNVGATEEVSIRDLAEMVVRIVGAGEVEVVDGREQDAPSRCPDMCRTHELLGWKAKVSLAEGLGRTVEWMRAHGAGPALAEAVCA
ncbi:NAD-dependent epimerase/dehydratase family protein [Nocardia sp. R6R-6]|uniref:NAD-dependent epimerase/dehydratase family protein n=1 Tax=Nocardia sp. R6R-6 TaxID=3459303 RepID=UPI00403D6741